MLMTVYGNFAALYEDYTQLGISEVDEIYTLGKYYQEDVNSGDDAQKLQVEVKKVRDNLKNWAKSKKNFNVIIFNREFAKAFNEGRKDAVNLH